MKWMLLILVTMLTCASNAQQRPVFSVLSKSGFHSSSGLVDSVSGIGSYHVGSTSGDVLRTAINGMVIQRAYNVTTFMGSAFVFPSSVGQLTNNFTIEMMIKTTTRVSPADAAFLSHEVVGANGWMFYMTAVGTTHMYLFVYGMTPNPVAISTRLFPDWTHFSLEMFNGSAEIYTNGLLAQQWSYSGSIGATVAPFTLGRYNDAGGSAPVDFTDLKIWRRKPDGYYRTQKSIEASILRSVDK